MILALILSNAKIDVLQQELRTNIGLIYHSNFDPEKCGERVRFLQLSSPILTNTVIAHV